MTDDTASSNGHTHTDHQANPSNKRYESTIAMDGHQPRPAPRPSVASGKVQGGYQAPSGPRPAVPTIGSGVKR